MIINYCVNPSCSNPKNHPKLKYCYTCGATLILSNRYRVIKKIGQGGFGATFIGVDLTITGNPLCLIKQLRPATEKPEALKMALDLFKRESETLAKIDHPNIPKLLNHFVENDQFYLVQDLIKGTNLRAGVKDKGVFSESATKRFLTKILPVIQYIHSQKVIHRDIKPANILRRQKDGKFILIDFGAVKDQVNTELIKTYGKTALTQFAIGTRGFVAPEQVAMRPLYASDIYSLGATCLYLLTGKSPKDMKLNADTGIPLWHKEILISSHFRTLLQKMLEYDVSNRYQTVEDVREHLDWIRREDKGNNNLIVHTHSLKNNLSGENLANSEITTGTFITEKLQKAIEEAENKRKNKDIPIIWSQKMFLWAYHIGKKDFNNQNLSNLALEQMKLSNFEFRHSKLEQIVFKNADLEGANFYCANLENANLQGANLQDAYLSKSNLQGVNLQGANLQGANLQGANLQDANLKGTNLRGTTVNLEKLNQAKTNWGTIYPDGSRKWWKLLNS